MAWKKVALVFAGGSDAARALMGRRIRITRAFPMLSYAPPGAPPPVQVSVAAGTTGFVARVPAEHMDKVVLAFPSAGPLPASLDALTRRPFKTALVNWPNFKENFDIEV